MKGTDCEACRGLLCQYCGCCHTLVCRVVVPVCESVRLVRSFASRDERWAYTLLFQKVAYLRTLQAHLPRTMADVYAQQMEADITMGVVLDTLARLLRPELRALVGQLSEAHWALWNVERLPVRPGLPSVVSKGVTR